MEVNPHHASLTPYAAVQNTNRPIQIKKGWLEIATSVRTKDFWQKWKSEGRATNGSLPSLSLAGIGGAGVP